MLKGFYRWMGKNTCALAEEPSLASLASVYHPWGLHSPYGHLVHVAQPLPYQHILNLGRRLGSHTHRDALVSRLRSSPNGVASPLLETGWGAGVRKAFGKAFGHGGLMLLRQQQQKADKKGGRTWPRGAASSFPTQPLTPGVSVKMGGAQRQGGVGECRATSGLGFPSEPCCHLAL